MTTPTPTQILLNRVKSFLDIADHSPAMCKVNQCAKCDAYWEARQEVLTAVSVVEREMGEVKETKI